MEFEFSADDLKFLAKKYSEHVRDLAAILSGNRLKRSLEIFGIKEEYLHLKNHKEISTAHFFEYTVSIVQLSHHVLSQFCSAVLSGSSPLHLALLNRDCNRLRELKEVFDDLTIKNEHGDTPLHSACLWGHNMEALVLLQGTIGSPKTENTSLDIPFQTKLLRLESGRTCLISFGQNNEGNTPLHLVCVHSHQVNLIKRLVECENSSIFTKNNSYKFPLQVANTFNRWEYIDILLQRNYILEFENCNSQIAELSKPSMSRSAIIEDYLQISRKLLHDYVVIGDELNLFDAMMEDIYKNDKGLLPIETWFLPLICLHQVNTWYCSLCLPRNSNFEVVDKILSTCLKRKVRHYTYTNPSTSLTRLERLPPTISCNTSSTATIQEIDELLNTCSSNVKAVHCMSTTYKRRMYLLKYSFVSCEVDTKNELGRTPFDEACMMGHFTACAWLMVREQCSIYLNIYQNDYDRCGAIQQICASTLLRFPEHSVINCIVPGDTLLHVAASMDNAAELLHYLINVMKFDVTKVNSRQEYPLHVACRTNQSAEVIKVFMNCDLEHRNIEGDSPLDLLFSHYHYELACHTASLLHQDFLTKLLGDIGDVKEWKKYNEKRVYHGMNTLLHIATKSCSKVEMLKKMTYENFMKWSCCRNILGELPLHWAACNGDLNSLKLVSNPGNYNTVTNKGNSVVHELCMYSANSNKDLEVLRFLHEDLRCNSHIADGKGQNALHISCQRGCFKLVDYLLEVAKLDPNVKDNTGSTPLMLTPLYQCDVIQSLIQYGADTSCLYKAYKTFFMNYSSENPPPTPLNVIVAGKHSSGKSTLIEALKSEDSIIGFAQAEPLTTGIISSFYQSKTFGTVMWYDLAGHSEYYASHEAVLNTVMSSSLPLVLLIVDIRKIQEIIHQEILYWLHFLQGQVEPKKFSMKPHIAVVFSFKDELDGCAQDKIDFTRAVLKPFFKKSNFEFVFFNALDCRKPSSAEIKLLRFQIEKSYSVLCDKTQLDFLLHCFYAFLMGSFKNEAAVTIQRVLELTEEWIATGIDPHFEQDDNDDSDESVESFDPEFQPDFEEECPAQLLPKDHKHIFDMCERLCSKGHVMVIKDSLKTAENSWIIINKDIILKEVNGSLFAPETFKQHYKNISTSTGVVTLSKLSEMFSEYNSVVISGLLTYLEFCNEIADEAVLHLLQLKTESCSDRYFFFPGLVSIEKPKWAWKDSKPSFNKCGWILHTTEPNSFFTPRLIQVLLLRLALAYPLSSKSKITGLPSLMVAQACSVWKNGLFWQTKMGLDCLIEVTDNSQAIVLMLRSTGRPLSDRCLTFGVHYRSNLITNILKTVDELSPSMSLEECILHPNCVTYPPLRCEEAALYSIRTIAEAICVKLPFVPSTSPKFDEAELTDILDFEPFIFSDNYRLFNESIHNLEVSDEDLQRLSVSLSTASPIHCAIYYNIFAISKAVISSGITISEEIMYKRLCQWRHTNKATYKDLHMLLGEYSIFGERDIQVSVKKTK